MELKREITLIVKGLFEIRKQKQVHIGAIRRVLDPMCPENDLLEALRQDEKELKQIDEIIEKQMSKFNGCENE
jgi:hypothetical protein